MYAWAWTNNTILCNIKVALVAMCFEISMLLKTASFHRKVHHNTSKLFFIYSIDK